MLAVQDAIPGTCSANTNPAAVSLSPRARAAAAAEAARAAEAPVGLGGFIAKSTLSQDNSEDYFLYMYFLT